MSILYEDASMRARCDSLGDGKPHDSRLAGDPVDAYVNHSRWVADCPNKPWCNAARMVATGYGFWCPMCGNPQVNGQELPVMFPAERENIVRVLELRPHASTRNWHPRDDKPIVYGWRPFIDRPPHVRLAVENLEMGDRVPGDLEQATMGYLDADWIARSGEPVNGLYLFREELRALEPR